MSRSPEHALELREVRGPSAFGGEAARFWSLLWMVSVTEFRVRYANTFLGYIWTILRPLIYFGVIFLIIRQVIRFGAGIPDYGLFLVLNIVIFQYFSEATSRAVRSVTSKEGMVRKVQFPRIIIPLSVSLTASYTLLLNFAAIVPLFLVFGLEPRWSWLLLGVIVILLFALTTSVGMILSVAFVRSEDTAQAWSLMTRLLFFGSPILYPIEMVESEVARSLLSINPLAPLLEQARVWVIDPTAMTAAEAAAGIGGLAIPVALLVGICAFGLWLFEREAPRVAEEL